MNSYHAPLVVCYVVAILLVMTTTRSPYGPLVLGLWGQAMLAQFAYHIYRSHNMWSSFQMYAVMYVLFVLSFSCIDMFFYKDSPHHYEGTIHSSTGPMLVDFVHLNMSIVSTIGYSDIVPKTTSTRAYSSYKMMVAIFMIVFLVSDIVVKTKKK